MKNKDLLLLIYQIKCQEISVDDAYSQITSMMLKTDKETLIKEIKDSLPPRRFLITQERDFNVIKSCPNQFKEFDTYLYAVATKEEMEAQLEELKERIKKETDEDRVKELKSFLSNRYIITEYKDIDAMNRWRTFDKLGV